MGDTSGSRGRCPSPDKLLFIDMVNQSEASQASSRKKARSHIMNQRHRRARKLSASSQCGTHLSHDNRPESSDLELHQNAATSDLAKAITEKGRLPSMEMAWRACQRTAPMVHDVLSPGFQMASHDMGHCAVPGTWSTLDEVYQEQQQAISMLWPRTPGLSSLRVLDTVAFQLDHRDRSLLFHYATVFNYTNMPVNSKAEWIQFAVTDDALLHMTLVIAALHIALLLGRRSSVDALRNQTRAVKLLHMRLNDPILSITDPTILAISCLALTEVFNALPLEATSHLNALEDIVRRRGGLQSLGFNGTVRRKVLWADLSSASSLQIPPRFPCPAEPLSPFPQSNIIHGGIYNSVMSSSCAGEVRSFMAGSHKSLEFSFIIQDIESLSIVLSQFNRSDMIMVDQLMLSDRFYDVERRAYDLFQAQHQHDVTTSADVSDHSTGTEYSLYTACYITVLIYIPLALREIPPLAGLFNTFIERLTTVMQDVKVMKAYVTFPKILLWILGTGGAAARGRKEREWYVTKLADFCQDWKLYEWDSMNKAFGNPMHLAPAYMKEFMNLWNEVEELRLLRDLE